MKTKRKFEVYDEVKGTNESIFLGIVHGTDQESVRRLVEKGRKVTRLTVIDVTKD